VRLLTICLEKWNIGTAKKHLRNSTIDVALLLGSSAWDITEPHPNATRTRPQFSDHLETCRRFVLKVQALYPNVTVMWKAPAAMVRTADFAPISRAYVYRAWELRSTRALLTKRSRTLAAFTQSRYDKMQTRCPLHQATALLQQLPGKVPLRRADQNNERAQCASIGCLRGKLFVCGPAPC
jgi:hypothetical protein